MFSFEGFLDLPLIWYGLIATAVSFTSCWTGSIWAWGCCFPLLPRIRAGIG